MLDYIDFCKLTDSPSYERVKGFRMANGYYYHMGHGWARLEHGGRIRVGFDDFLVRFFASMQTLELPMLGATLKQHQMGWRLGGDDHKATVLSSVTGTVFSFNHRTQQHPEITREDPYHEGRAFILEPDPPKMNLRELYFGKESFQWMEQECKRPLSLIGSEDEQMAAKGGKPSTTFSVISRKSDGIG